MSKTLYAELLRKELEENKSLSNEQRIEILRYLAKIETTKQLTIRTKIKNKIPVKLKKPREKLAELPPLKPAEETAVSMGEQVEIIIAEMQKETEKQENSNGEEVHPKGDQASGTGN